MTHFLLFTGHMIDAADRQTPRFPASKEPAVREAIRKCLSAQKRTAQGELKGIAAAACGGDMLFHELCRELGIPSEIYLGLPAAEFEQTSVSFAGPALRHRYEVLIKQLPVHLMKDEYHQDLQLPVWERANRWMLAEALRNGGGHMTLIALWDGKAGDGKGGTKHMISIAEQKGAKVEVIPIL